MTALGQGWRANADGFRTGRTAFRPVTLFDVTQQRSKIAAEVDVPDSLPALRLSSKQVARLDRSARMMLLAAHEAAEQAEWRAGENAQVFLGTTSGGMRLGECYLRQALETPLRVRRQPTRVVQYQAQRQALDLAAAFGWSGPVTVISNACASGANAIGRAWEALREGTTRRALAGGYDALCHLTFAGFDALQSLSPQPCRPFDEHRDGLSLGEGAAALALETLEHARERGAEILGELIGYAAVTDTFHLTQPHPEGAAAFASMANACRVAGITPDDVDYVNAHGTATPQNDSTEAAAINRWAGRRVATLPVSSIKGSIGHTLGAAGAVEAVVCLMALREHWLPPEPSLETPAACCQFPIVRHPTDAPGRVEAERERRALGVAEMIRDAPGGLPPAWCERPVPVCEARVTAARLRVTEHRGPSSRPYPDERPRRPETRSPSPRGRAQQRGDDVAQDELGVVPASSRRCCAPRTSSSRSSRATSTASDRANRAAASRASASAAARPASASAIASSVPSLSSRRFNRQGRSNPRSSPGDAHRGRGDDRRREPRADDQRQRLLDPAKVTTARARNSPAIETADAAASRAVLRTSGPRRAAEARDPANEQHELVDEIAGDVVDGLRATSSPAEAGLDLDAPVLPACTSSA